ncbi:MAG TPA: SRPBCC domain-containing protein [Mucilaginibacter sp.]|nr:SRPBCC domain-containing protein [Mucilaginibacter sp.]
MKNMNYNISIQVGASPSEVFRHITDVPKWWGGEDFAGSSTQINDEFTIIHADTHYSKHRVIELIPDKRLVWLVTESKLSWLQNQQEWTNTKMIFEINPNDKNTEVLFTHEGLVPEKECYERCTQGWHMVISERLFNCINTNNNAL